MTRKVVFIVFTFAIVAALLTMAVYPMGMMTTNRYERSVAQVAPGEKMTFDMKETVDPAMGMGTVNMVRPMPMPDSPIYPGMGGSNAMYVNDRTNLKYSSHGLFVTNVSDYMHQAKDYIQSQGGRVLSSSQSTTDDMQYGFINAKVPVEVFDQVNTEVTSKARKVMNQSINATDVTGSRVGMEDQLQALQDQKTKLESDLADAKTVADKKIIQATIDRVDQQIKYQQKMADQFAEEAKFATVNITVSDSERFFNPMSNPSLHTELRRAWMSLGGTSHGIATFLVWVLVYAVIWLPIVLIFRWIVQKINKKSSK